MVNSIIDNDVKPTETEILKVGVYNGTSTLEEKLANN
jgi:hypothetical protein